MQNNLSKFTKAFTSMACFSFIFISNNSELAARYLLNKEGEFKKIKINNKNTNQYLNDPISAFNFVKKNNMLVVDNGERDSDENVLISEIIIEGWENHPEGRKLELAAYDSMTIKPGSVINNKKLELAERFDAQLKLNKLPKNSAKIRIRNRCEVSGRPHGVYRKLRISRIALRDMASAGKIPGITKSSW